MTECPHCGAALYAPLPASCPECLSVLETGITSAPIAGADGRLAEGAAPASFDAELPSIVKPGTTGPSCPGALLVVLSVFLCGSQGAMANFGKPGRFTFDTQETVIGAIVGLVVGLALAIDHWFFRRKLNVPAKVAEDDSDPETHRALERPSDWVPAAMLILPVASAAVTWFSSALHLTEMDVSLIGSGTIILTAVLGYFSIRQVALRMDRSSTYHGALASPAYMYLAMMALWIVCYPVHFLIRGRLGGRNLTVPGLLATAAYLVPIAQPFLVEPELPPVDDAEVLSLVKQLMGADHALGPITLKQPVEVSFDVNQQKRIGRCTVASKHGEEKIDYTIDWQNKQAGIWQVQVPHLLPAVDAKEVIAVLNGLVQPDQFGVVDLRHPAQTSYDPARQKRMGRAVRVSRDGEVPIAYVVEWDDRSKGMFRVNLQP